MVPCFEDVDTLRLSEGKSDSSSDFFFQTSPAPRPAFLGCAAAGASLGGRLAAGGRALRGLSKQELSRACGASRPARMPAGKLPGEPRGGRILCPPRRPTATEGKRQRCPSPGVPRRPGPPERGVRTRSLLPLPFPRGQPA